MSEPNSESDSSTTSSSSAEASASAPDGTTNGADSSSESSEGEAGGGSASSASENGSASGLEAKGKPENKGSVLPPRPARQSRSKAPRGRKGLSSGKRRGLKSLPPKGEAGADGKVARDGTDEIDETLELEEVAPAPPSSTGLKPPRRGSAPPPPPSRAPGAKSSRVPLPSLPGVPSRAPSSDTGMAVPELPRGSLSSSRLPPPPPLKSRTPVAPPVAPAPPTVSKAPASAPPPAPPSRRPPAPKPGLSPAAGVSPPNLGLAPLPAPPAVVAPSGSPVATPLPAQATPLSPGVVPRAKPPVPPQAADGTAEDLDDEALLDADELSAPPVEEQAEPEQVTIAQLDAQPLPPPVAPLPLAEPDAQPTQFDVSAGERHASPWTQAGQLEAMQAHAEQLIELFESQLARKPPKAREGRLHYEVARLYESPLGQLDEAARHYEHAARILSQHIPSIRGARRVLVALKRFKQALKLFEAEISASGDTGYKAMLYYQKGRLLAEHLGQRADARAAFEKAAELAPASLDILKALAGAEEQAGAYNKLMSALESAANAAAFAPERAAYLAQMGRVCALYLKDPQRAIELYKAALAEDSNAPGALPSLKELLYAERRWKELVEVLELEAGLASTREAQAFAKFRAGKLWVERLGDFGRGVATIEQASALTPQDLAMLEELVRLYEVSGQAKNLASALERLAAQQQSPPVELLHRLGELYERDLNQPEYAISRYSAALQVNPAHRPTTLALKALYEQRGEWRPLAEMLSKEAELSEEPLHRGALHARIAELCEVRLGSVDYALEHHKKALELRPGYDVSFKALVRLYSQLHRWPELIEVYRRGIEAAKDDDERIALMFAIGRLEEEALAMPEAAAATYRGILELAPDSLEAIHALQRAADRGREFRALVEALLLEVDRIKDRERQLALRHRAACIMADELHETEDAVEALGALIKSAPTYQPSIVKLSELLFDAERWAELLDAHAAELSITSDGAQRAQLLYRMGMLCEQRLADSSRAIKYLRQAVQSDSDHHPATVALRRLLLKTEQYEEVSKLLESEANLVEERRGSARVWLLLGEVCEHRLDNFERALFAYKKAKELDPALRPAVDGCLRLLEQSHDHKQLAEHLAMEQEEALEPMYAVSAAFRAAETQRDHLGQVKAAAATFEQMLERDPRHTGALLALERIYSQSGERDALARIYECQAAAFDDATARVAAYRGLLTALERADELDTARIRQTQMALLSVAPNDVQALLALEALAVSSKDVVLTAQLDAKLGVAGLDRQSTAAYQTRLAEAMEARGDRSALEVYRAALAHDPESMAAARGISRIAEGSMSPDLLAEAAEHEAKVLERIDEGARLLVLAAGKLATAGDVNGAARALSRALHLDPDHARAADALVALQNRGLGADFIADALSRAAGDARSKDRRAALWILVARLESRSKRDIGAATAAVQRALKERPNDVDAHLLLAHFHAGAKKWDECVAQLQSLLKLNPSDDVRFDALLRLATIQHERLKQTAIAANNVSAALKMQPDNREALELMLRVQLDREELSAAAKTAERLVETAQSDPERARALYHSARLYRQQGDLKKASEAFAEALSLTGTDDAVAQEYHDWLEARRAKADWQPYAEALRTYLTRPDLPEQKVMWARRSLGLVLYDKLDEKGDGLSQLKRALSLEPQDAELRRAYAERLERAGDFAPAAEEYHQLLLASPHAVGYWRALAACYRGLGKSDQARAALAPLIASGEATDDERESYRVETNPDGAKSGAFGTQALASAEQGLQVSGLVVDLLQALEPALTKLYPTPFERYGVSTKDKIVARGEHPLRRLSERFAAVFGVEEFDLYVHRTGQSGVSVECGEQPALFIHRDFEKASSTEQAFVLARVFSNIARGILLLDKLPVTELELLLVCAARNYQPGFGSELGDPGTLDAQARRINKAFPWFKGNRVEPAARAFAASGVKVQEWATEAHIAAIRAACLVCDDPALGLAKVASSGADDRVVERVASFLASDVGQALKKRVFA